jgi:hypothetical protein
MNTPEQTTADGMTPRRAANPAMTEELDLLITRAEALQRTLRLNDAEFALQKKEYLLSLDTWQRTLKDADPKRLGARGVAKWTLCLRRMLDDAEGSGGNEQFYPLPILAEAVMLYNKLQGSRGGITVGWLNGTTGSGKSWALRFLRRKYPRDTFYMFVPPTMRDSRGAIVHGLAEAIGVGRGASTDATLRLVVARLLIRPCTLLIDEVHAGGIEIVKVIKSLVDLAPQCRFILTTWPQGFDDLRRATNRVETSQLVGRSLRPFIHHWQKGPRREDIEAFLLHAAPEITDAGERRLLAGEFLNATSQWGFRLLRQVVDTARAEAEAADAPLTAEGLRTAFYPLSADVVDYSPRSGA